jgi:hypothetical protein
MKGAVPYTWRIGVDNAFGYLTRSDGAHLAESRRFLGPSGLAVSLTDGRALLTPADGRNHWQPVGAARACELAGIPEPALDGAAETSRRLDPFHVERHTSPLFLALVTVAHEKKLPCGYALRAWITGHWDGTFQGAYLEQPETFAASVLERIAATGTPIEAAVVRQLHTEALIDPAAVERSVLASDSGWQTVLGDIAGIASEFTARMARDREAQQSADRGASDQLTLI